MGPWRESSHILFLVPARGHELVVEMPLGLAQIVALDGDGAEPSPVDHLGLGPQVRVPGEDPERFQRLAQSDRITRGEAGLDHRHHQARGADLEPAGRLRAEALATKQVQSVCLSARERFVLGMKDSSPIRIADRYRS